MKKRKFLQLIHFSKNIPIINKSKITAIRSSLIASSYKSSYASGVQCKITELVVEDYKSQQAYNPFQDFFVRKISMRSHFMAKLERDTFECTGHLLSLSSNPFQLCHHHLEVISKAPLNQQEYISHVSFKSKNVFN